MIFHFLSRTNIQYVSVFIITFAPYCMSLHCFRLSVDVCPVCSKNYKTLCCLKSTNIHIPSFLLPQGVAGKFVGHKVFRHFFLCFYVVFVF